jgi:hypothetical protein
VTGRNIREQLDEVERLLNEVSLRLMVGEGQMVAVEGYVWCDKHCEVHEATEDPYSEGEPCMGKSTWRTIYMARAEGEYE